MNACFPLVLADAPASAGPLIVLVAVMLALTAGLIGLGFYLEARRTKRFAALAAARGFKFRPAATTADDSLLKDSHLAAHGHSPRISNIIEAANVNDVALTLFDFAYTVGHARSRKRRMRTVLRMQSRLLQLPAFVMKPESIFAKMGDMEGYADINFPEAPQFSKACLLRGEDEAAVRQVFTPEVIRFCEGHPNISIEGNGDRLLVYRERRRLKLEDFDAFVAEGQELAALFVARNQGELRGRL